jgi:hypothetical protein
MMIETHKFKKHKQFINVAIFSNIHKFTYLRLCISTNFTTTTSTTTTYSSIFTTSTFIISIKHDLVKVYKTALDITFTSYNKL